MIENDSSITTCPDSSYEETADQMFNLVDGDAGLVSDFYEELPKSTETNDEPVRSWLSANTKHEDLSDLMQKGMTVSSFSKWISSPYGKKYMKNGTPIKPVDVSQPDKETIRDGMDAEDDSIAGFDSSYSSNAIDSSVEIQAALDMLASEENSSEEDYPNIVFDIVDGSEDSSNDFETDYNVNSDGSEDSSDDFETDSIDNSDGSDVIIIHKKRIHLDHHLNTVVKTIDDDEISDRTIHEKYYVLKKAELKTQDKLNSLEEALDAINCSYYDFPSIAVKIYHGNEVELNRVFRKCKLDVRCRDIAHYTKDWNSK